MEFELMANFDYLYDGRYVGRCALTRKGKKRSISANPNKRDEMIVDEWGDIDNARTKQNEKERD
jgi:hypothetical protein